MFSATLLGQNHHSINHANAVDTSFSVTSSFGLLGKALPLLTSDLGWLLLLPFTWLVHSCLPPQYLLGNW
jgi:hypothetical protein